MSDSTANADPHHLPQEARTQASVQRVHPLVPAFILRQHAAGVFDGELAGCAMFVDVSGFSAMMDGLMVHGQHGAEIVANIMRAALEPAIESVFDHGGMVVSQAGDAFTAVFPAGDGDERAAGAALAAAMAIQTLRQETPVYATPHGPFAIGVKIGLDAGRIQWGIVRSDDDRRALYYFRGPAIDGCAAAEHSAQAGETLVSRRFHDLLAGRITADERGEFVCVRAITGALPGLPLLVPPPPDLDLMSRYFPRSVLLQNHSGEFRWVVNVFIALPTVRTTGQLQAFMQTVFELQERYGGYITRLDFGDKGANLLAFWGAPVAYENDIQRALGFLIDLPTRTSIPVSAGVSYRIAHAGAIGGIRAEEYTCYGRGINLAARLMAASARGDLLTDGEIARRAERHFDLEYLGERSFKGFAEKQAVYQLFDRKETREDLFRWPLVGRQQEMEQIEAFLTPLAGGDCAGTLIILGEAGAGKSHLVDAVRRSPLVESMGARWAHCQADAVMRASLNPFRYWLLDFFGQSHTQTEARNKLAFNRRLDALITSPSSNDLAQELDRTRSFLGALLGLHWPDSLYEEMDAEGRFENTLQGLITLLKAESRRQPVILHIEDVQWLDADSLTLMERLWRNISGRPVALLVTVRREQLSDKIGARLFALIREMPWGKIDLERLQPDDVSTLAAHILDAPPAPALVRLIQQRTEGNPLFVEQFVLHIKEQGLLEQDETGALDIQRLAERIVPADVQALIIARIDMLSAEIRTVVHTASVLGREFDLHLLSLMLQDAPALQDKVRSAEQAAIWQALAELRYIFRHALVRDTAYGMLVHERRAALHRLAADAMASSFAQDLAPHYGAIGFHYEQAGMAEPATRYLSLAGRQAADAFQNQAAIDQLSRALGLAADASQRFDLLLARESVFDRLGQRADQRRDLEEAQRLAEAVAEAQQRAEVALRLANLARVQSDPQTALQHLDQALEVAGQAGWQPGEARVWLLRGMISFARGDYDAASQQLNTAHRTASAGGDQTLAAEALYNLGNCALANHDYEQARQNYGDALAVYRDTRQRRGEINCLLMSGVIDRRLGNLDEAIQTYEQALAAAREIGWRHGESYLLGHLGNHAFEMADYDEAERLHRAALEINIALGDRMLQAQGLDTLGLIDHVRGNLAEAISRYEQALAIQRAIDYRRGLGFTLTHLGDARADMGEITPARAAFSEALEIRQSLRDGKALAVDDMAGLARVALAEGNLAEAGDWARQVVDWLAGNGPAGVEFPALACLSAYEALSQSGDGAGAREALRLGHAWLMERSAQISNAVLREKFMQADPHHRALLASWQAQQSGNA